MKSRPVGAELFHADGRMDRQTHDKANNCFSQFCERAYSLCEKHQHNLWAKLKTYRNFEIVGTTGNQNAIDGYCNMC